MGGIKGCLPAHCDAYTDLESAVDSAQQIYDCNEYAITVVDGIIRDSEYLIEHMPVALKRDRYLDLEDFHFVPFDVSAIHWNGKVIPGDILNKAWDDHVDSVDDTAINLFDVLYTEHGIKGNHFFGNEYISISECGCPTPWIHSEMGDLEYWTDNGYHRFIVTEYLTGYELTDLVTDETHWLSDGVDVLFDENDEPISPGTEDFRQLWEDVLNEPFSETLEACFPQQAEKESRGCWY
jgi:hypothetical protein